LARSLVAMENDPSRSSPQTEPATLRVYEKLRRQLGAPVGVDGFQALASRALALAKAESPRLSVVQVTASGSLRGLDEAASKTHADEDGEAGTLLIAQLLGLFLTFLGEATTLRLIEDLRHQVDVRTEPVTIPKSGSSSGVSEISTAVAFEDLLLEVNRLRDVSEHIEALVETHPGMQDGLLSVAGNLRSIATVLDIFTLIRSRAGVPQDEFPNPETNRYMN